jgi:hypothetical protein
MYLQGVGLLDPHDEPDIRIVHSNDAGSLEIELALELRPFVSFVPLSPAGGNTVPHR